MTATDANAEDFEPGYQIVINHEEQYSVWPVNRKIPLGWIVVGAPRTKQECLQYIDEVWTDIMPLSVRRRSIGSIAQ
ncbi:antibiotic synthesis protein MbtH [Streptomyces noursei ZPM]|uniref:MbtH protein n=1 Tax=Streptomyces noursei TaxID=1971 RepID=A0A401QRQ1_STRNR|nr:MbtH family NRPS accessory protein [Streptomyces noursei]AKA01175.1 antibiotic synthesis protein MbtH [Streptomyces noursei ZPM]AKA08238.1 antibiotic synthesis protein MbtH [Streptomyces noursei ZPM]EOT05057.1 hypothetical protein K530_05390 [Streptomyces noursei CCRC 11814]EXU92377.1 antibiotic synthesis protein MbtH [Streptomyces noursei PD-1]UWS76909.1 MbtH family NRPS accessory protein [Streptomyces noursei]